VWRGTQLDAYVIERARQLAAQRGMAGANIVHRALDAFCPGGRVQFADDRQACIELRQLVDEAFCGGQGASWFVREYVTRRVHDPIASRLFESLRDPSNAPAIGGPATVAHLPGGPGEGGGPP
jgi:hypothetical protein